jgi:hypothetical protein
MRPTDTRDEIPRPEYEARETLVYRLHKPACGSKGPDKATCLREPGHLGEWCEGNGFDPYGPKYRRWNNKRA